jgi:hypothetical protein
MILTDPAPVYTNADRTAAVAHVEGRGAVLFTTENAAAWDALMASGVPIGDYAAPVPFRAVHAAWIKAALAEIGKTEDVRNLLASAPVKLALWENVTTVRDDHPDIKGVAGALGIDLADLFNRAERLRTANGG